MFVIITQNICSCCFCLNYSIWGYKVLMLLVALRILMFHCCNLLRISLQLNRNYFSRAWKNNIFYTNNKKKKVPCSIFFQCSKLFTWQGSICSNPTCSIFQNWTEYYTFLQSWQEKKIKLNQFSIGDVISSLLWRSLACCALLSP